MLSYRFIISSSFCFTAKTISIRWNILYIVLQTFKEILAIVWSSIIRSHAHNKIYERTKREKHEHRKQISYNNLLSLCKRDIIITINIESFWLCRHIRTFAHSYIRIKHFPLVYSTQRSIFIYFLICVRECVCPACVSARYV